ncbi:hypothetical protein [Pectobacterium phage PPWS2]|uniref:Uncharacterized protein n=1 Tax=Pectobacterium phage PPWS2 TaxID=2153295 RepID=A0A3G9DSS9_9CAUD|nr:hypothetical protein HOU58_gp19 [Pectobacterium phage PPWS2]BBD74651.1 hypothetical protein [Pectobacterium phage PPWS2]
MAKIKKWFWVAVRMVTLGPMAVVIVLGGWCDEASPAIEQFLNELEGK